MSLDLVSVTNASQVVAAISQQLSISSHVKDSIASTVLTLSEIQRAFDQDGALSTFLPHRLLFLPPRAQGVKQPPDNVAQYLCELAVLANAAAQSLSCSSILAGEGSESDDTGDVALWLGEGDFGPGKEYDILKVLELSPWLDQGAKVTQVKLLSYDLTLPRTLSGRTLSSEVQALVRKMNEMADRHCFRVSSTTTAPLVVFFLVGRFMVGETLQWGGLIGIGTWSDE